MIAWLVLLALAACREAHPSSPISGGTPGPKASLLAFSQTPVPPATLIPTPSRQLPSPSPTRLLLSATPDPLVMLVARLKSSLGPTGTPAPFPSPGFDGLNDVQVFQLKLAPTLPPLWVAYSIGTHRYLPAQNHFVGIYRHDQDDWKVLSRVELSNTDRLEAGAVQQVPLDPRHVWLAVQGSAGVHGACFDLLSFDGARLAVAVSNCSSTPPAAELRDLDGDGIAEVILNWSEEHVFCYSCGLRIPAYGLLRWDGTALVPVDLAEADQASPAVKAANHQALIMARANLWKDAEAAIEPVMVLDPKDEIVARNATLIRLNAEARRGAILGSPYPLLSELFYGDYPALLARFRSLKPEGIFNPQTPLVKGTAAQDYPDALWRWIDEYTRQALKVQPDLAMAYYLRSWIAYLRNPKDAEVLQGLNRAVQLQPKEALFKDCLDYIRQLPVVKPPTPDSGGG